MKNIIRIKKRSGSLEELDITKIQKMTIPATIDLDGVSQSELEVDAHLQFIDGMSSADIQDALIKTAVNKIDIDVPNWTFVAARLFTFDLYHRVGIATSGSKGSPYSHISTYLEHGKSEGKLLSNLGNGFDLEKINNAIVTDRDFLFNYLGVKTLYDRYLIKDKNGNPIELPQHMFMAVAMFLAQNEEDSVKDDVAIQFYNVISKFEVMLATPTLSNARTYRHQLSSCYIGSSPDNIEGIFDSYKEMGLLSKFGGGIGWDYNLIRAIGGDIDNTKYAAGGTIPFLKINNDVAVAIDQLGTRRGAIAVYLEPWHADIDDFIDLKKNSGEERRRAHDLFPALWITDLFMERVLEDANWTLFDPYDVPELSETFGEEFKLNYLKAESNNDIRQKTIKAKDLWKKILTSYAESGSPFLCFKDTANRANPNAHVGHIRSSNLCTEIFQNTEPNYYLIKLWINDGKSFVLCHENDTIELSDGTKKLGKKVTSLDTIISITDTKNEVTHNLGKESKVYCVEKEKVDGRTAVCNLASVNLSKINSQEDLERVVPIAVRMLDNVIDLNFYPLKKVKDTNLQSRAIGLGVMGEAQMLAEKQIMFGSQEHFNLIDELMEQFSYYTIKASSDLAVEKGSYPDFEGSNWSKGIMPFHHTKDEVNLLTESSRVPNDFMDKYDDLIEKVKKDGMRNGYLMAIAPTSSISILVGTTQAIEPVYKKKWYEENLSGLIPVVVPNLNPNTWNYYPSAYDVDQLNIIKAAAIRQKWIDQGQSTNIFINPETTTGKILNDIYMLAWKLGCKSTYYLRSQSPEAKVDVADRSLECSGCQ